MKLNWYKCTGSKSTEEHNVWYKTGSFGDDAVNENSTLRWVPAQKENSPKHSPVHHIYAKPPAARKGRMLLGIKKPCRKAKLWLRSRKRERE